jgi:alkanesulfonate monooxygenase SsuD/methylene tetrahydromethanopterin reductase-like flavin-dependent oxidoreductase (luciferase family)
MHDLRFGTFITPTARQPRRAVELAQLSERSGLDLVTFQDHPYQPSFLDTWTLLAYTAAVTERVSLSGNVLNLPLRGPSILAKSAASLDLLSDGRFELGLGAGAFWDAIVALGGDRLSPGESVDALDEAIRIIRGIWDVDDRAVLRVDGAHHRVAGPKRGPAPAHDVGIWLGAYKPRMLRLVGRAADGWLPSLGRLQPGQLADGHKVIDEAAQDAGRDPAAIRRLLNVGGDVTVGQLAELAVDGRIDTFVVAADDPDLIQRLGEEIAPATRQLVGSAPA